jgi:hypothetical protein
VTVRNAGYACAAGTVDSVRRRAVSHKQVPAPPSGSAHKGGKQPQLFGFLLCNIIIAVMR